MSRRTEISGAGFLVSAIFCGMFLFGVASCAVRVHEVAQERVRETRARQECADHWEPGECFDQYLQREGP